MAVGKSTTARILRELLARWPGTPRVELVTTDGFLYPNAELERRGLLQRKGFPESYDRRALLRFVAEVKAGPSRGQRAGLLPPDLRHRAAASAWSCAGPTCSSSRASTCCSRRGCSPTGASGLAVSDFFDFSVYVDARIEDIRRVVRRALPAAARDGVRRPALVLPPLRRRSPTTRPGPPPSGSGRRSTSPTCVENVLPTRGRATLVLTKGEDHSVRRVRLRKL